MQNELMRRDPVSGDAVIVNVKKEELVTILPEDTDDLPEVPIADNRIEQLLSAIVDGKVVGAANMLHEYLKCGFPKDAPPYVVKNAMRVLINKQRVKMRLAYLRKAEWELNRPDESYLCGKLEEILNSGDEDNPLRPQDKISAINAYSKLAGLDKAPTGQAAAKIVLQFNSQEAPNVSINADEQ